MNDWQSISTAPRDGTVIDLWFAGEWNRRMSDAWWSEPIKAWVVDGRGCSYLDSPEITHWMPLPTSPQHADDIAFLARMLEAAEWQTRVSQEDIARLRKMADWADAAPPTKWYGIIDKNETKRAVAAATKRMSIE
jgi:hypothetical protein